MISAARDRCRVAGSGTAGGGQGNGYEIPARHTSWILKCRNESILIWGTFVGLAVGMTSVGSGSPIARFLLVIMPGSTARVVGTDVFHAELLVSATAFVHQQAGNVDWNLVAIHSAVPLRSGVLIGSYLAPRLPDRMLRFGPAAVLFATSLLACLQSILDRIGTDH